MMKNFLFISPNFPTNYWQFCRALQENGLRVLGIGDCPYDQLAPELRAALTEYFRVDSLENEEEVYRAVAFLIYRHGRIDHLESNNEYWLERDAALRTAFHITSGLQSEEMAPVKRKSAMKARYAQAGIPVARWHLVDDLEGCRAFIEGIGGYPVIVKPDVGVGATHTYKLTDDAALKHFFSEKSDEPYILEEFIRGTVHSYDAIFDSQGRPLFETGNVTLQSIMDTVNTRGNACYYIEKHLPEAMREAGRRTAAAFQVRSRFVHFEFFVLDIDQPAGRAGEIVGLEVNMRPSGGFSCEMFNYANSTDVYRIYADMIAFDRTDLAPDAGAHYYCCFCGRRDGLPFALDDAAIHARYGGALRMSGRLPEALSGAMADTMYMVVFSEPEARDAFFHSLTQLR